MKKRTASLALASAAALVLIGAGPASAVGNSIDPGDSLYAVACDAEVYNDWQLMSVESSTAVSTPIGTGGGTASDDTCAYQPAWDSSTGKSYYIQVVYGEPDTSVLTLIDPATGVSTVVDQFYEVSGEFILHPFINAIAIGAGGAAYALDEGGYLYSVDLESAKLTSISPTGYTNVYAFAYDAKTAAYYFIQDEGDIYSLDVTSGFADYIDSFPSIPGFQAIDSLQFDEAGTWWIMLYSLDIEADDFVAQLASFTLPTLATPAVSGTFTDDPYYTEALLIIPGAALAATGTDFSVAPIAAGLAGVVTLLGAVVVVTRRRRTA